MKKQSLNTYELTKQVLKKQKFKKSKIFEECQYAIMFKTPEEAAKIVLKYYPHNICVDYTTGKITFFNFDIDGFESRYMMSIGEALKIITKAIKNK